ncbi:MAG: 16S rRNA (cytosine(1402)-N(4))-methyltransferase RsmH [Candidatus Babeliaceae bacterium]|nr:16S rRNA (cytosine(1402)-N(4))-methyltransferase RsmH [Candidatus Babeliaceae bacterium]
MVEKSFNIEFHKSVLIAEVLTYLAPRPGGLYVDATFGGGGHTYAILAHEPGCRVIACDWDAESLERNSALVREQFGERLETIWGNFAQLPQLLKKKGFPRVDGVLADFGTSQFQITERAGFSFTGTAPLDMRMSQAHGQLTAEELIRRASEEELSYIFHTFGEERFSRRIARAVVAARRERPIKTTADLVKVILSVVPKRLGGLHPATRVFQALRIVVNRELENIQTFLGHLPQILAPEGRAVCISFHSLEDRLVKTYFRDNKDLFEVLTPKVVIPQDEEVHENPSARSARLRAAQFRGVK